MAYDSALCKRHGVVFWPHPAAAVHETTSAPGRNASARRARSGGPFPPCRLFRLLLASSSPLIAFAPASWAAGAGLALGLAGVLALAAQGRQVAGTTLLAVWAWALAALLGLTAATVAGMLGADALGKKGVALVHYLASTLALTPGLALLGAKRPQSGMWQGVVAALLAMAWIPAGLAFALPAQPQLEVPIYLRGLELALVLMVAANYVATRHVLLAAWASVGLLVTQASWWFELSPAEIAWTTFHGLAACACVALLSWLPSSERAKSSPADRLWLDFRDAYGALWALRVAERVNALAELNGWKLRLLWNGFAPSESGEEGASPDLPPDARELAGAEKTLRSLLRRFVSPDWIAARASEDTIAR